MLQDRLRARRLVDADRPDRAVGLREDVAADPADVVGHLVARRGRALRRRLEVGRGAPAVAAENCVELHGCLLFGCVGYTVWTRWRGGRSRLRQGIVKAREHSTRLGTVTIRITLLGDVGVERDGARVGLPTSGKATALLVWLALNPGEHARARVAPLLWPEVLDESARGSLRTAVWALRNALGPEALVTTRTTLGLAPDVVRRRARAPPPDRVGPHGGGGRARPRRARARGRGGVAGRGARGAPRDAGRAVRAGCRRSRRLPATIAGAVVWARRRVWLDPVSEEAQQALLRRLAAVGDRAGALHSFSRFRTRLRTDLGLAPSPETVALVETIRSADTAARPSLPARLAAAAGETHGGPGDELERLAARFASGRRGASPRGRRHLGGFRRRGRRV